MLRIEGLEVADTALAGSDDASWEVALPKIDEVGVAVGSGFREKLSGLVNNRELGLLMVSLGLECKLVLQLSSFKLFD